MDITRATGKTREDHHSDAAGAGTHDGHRRRLRERFLSEGIDAFSDHQILELLLFYGVPRKDTNLHAHRLMERYGSLSAALEADPRDVAEHGGVSLNAATLVCMIPQIARRYMMDRWRDKPKLNSTERAAEYAIGLFVGRRYESLYAICLDAQCRALMSEQVCSGTLDEVPVYPRLVVETALRHKAAAVILAHNHPGGTAKPSNADIDVTEKLSSALSTISVKLVDHIIVAGTQYVSLAEQGIVQPPQRSR